MRLIGGMLARNEDWILGFSARAALEWLDHLIIFDHASTDGTHEIARHISCEYPDRVTVIREEDPVWYEMRYRQAMLTEARKLGATHFATVDSDEILTANLIPRARAFVEATPDYAVLEFPWVCLARGLGRYYSGGVWYANWVDVAFRDNALYYWEARNGYDFHHRQPMAPRQLAIFRPVAQHYKPDLHQGGLMHLQFVSERRLKAKQAAYQIQEVLRWPNRERVDIVRERYQPAIFQSDPSNVATAACPATWFLGYEHLMRHFYPHAEPWQEAWCREMVAKHGEERFEGLDLFGVA